MPRFPIPLDSAAVPCPSFGYSHEQGIKSLTLTANVSVTRRTPRREVMSAIVDRCSIFWAGGRAAHGKGTHVPSRRHDHIEVPWACHYAGPRQQWPRIPRRWPMTLSTSRDHGDAEKTGCVAMWDASGSPSLDYVGRLGGPCCEGARVCMAMKG